jgi:hypothetical protein
MRNKPFELISELATWQELTEWDATEILKYTQYDLVALYFTEEDFLKLAFSLKKFAGTKIDEGSGAKIPKLLRTKPFDKNLPRQHCRAVLTSNQYQKVVSYLLKNQFYCHSFGKDKPVDAVLALSFGKSNAVNADLAQKVETLLSEYPDLQVFAQWEVFDLIRQRHRYSKLNRLGDKRSRYITTSQVIDKFILSGQSMPTKIGLVAQSWHAPRCIEMCSEKGLQVVRGLFVDKFSPNDPQLWVKDVLSWIIKESQK